MVNFNSQVFSQEKLENMGAIILLKQYVENDSPYLSRFNKKCIVYKIEKYAVEYIYISLKEVHNSFCGGDPDTFPTIDLYRIDRNTKAIEIYDADSNVYFNINNPY